MVLYSNPSEKADPLSSVSVKALCRRPQAERDAVAAEVYDTGRPVSGLSKSRLAALFNTSVSAIDKRRTRRGAPRGKRSLADHLRQATPAERRDAARDCPDIIREMIAPASENTQASFSFAAE